METKDNKRLHLEFIQNVITRMNSNSFSVKGWAVTIISALFALSANGSHYQFTYIVPPVLVIFWGLDAYYLALEKRYRDFYQTILSKDEADIDFNMEIPDTIVKGRTVWSCVFTDSIAPLYIFISLVTGCVYYFMMHL